MNAFCRVRLTISCMTGWPAGSTPAVLRYTGERPGAGGQPETRGAEGQGELTPYEVVYEIAREDLQPGLRERVVRVPVEVFLQRRSEHRHQRSVQRLERPSQARKRRCGIRVGHSRALLMPV